MNILLKIYKLFADMVKKAIPLHCNTLVNSNKLNKYNNRNNNRNNKYNNIKINNNKYNTIKLYYLFNILRS